MVDTTKADQAELSIEAALRGVAEVRDGGSPEPVIQNLYRAVQEVMDAADYSAGRPHPPARA